MGIDQSGNVAADPTLRQRRHDDIALPFAISLGVPVLDRAAAADPEMRAERRNPLRACKFDLDQAPAVGMTRYCCHFDRLAAKRVRHIDARSAGHRDAIAAMADMIDDEALDISHGARR